MPSLVWVLFAGLNRDNSPALLRLRAMLPMVVLRAELAEERAVAAALAAYLQPVRTAEHQAKKMQPTVEQPARQGGVDAQTKEAEQARQLEE